MGGLISFFLHQLLYQIPTLVVIGVGLLFAILRWKTAPRAMMLVLLGLGLYGLGIFAWAALQAVNVSTRIELFLWTLLIWGHVFWQAATFALALSGAFVGRQPASRGFPLETTVNRVPPVYPQR